MNGQPNTSKSLVFLESVKSLNSSSFMTLIRRQAINDIDVKIGPQCERVPRESDIVMAGCEWT